MDLAVLASKRECVKALERGSERRVEQRRGSTQLLSPDCRDGDPKTKSRCIIHLDARIEVELGPDRRHPRIADIGGQTDARSSYGGSRTVGAAGVGKCQSRYLINE